MAEQTLEQHPGVEQKQDERQDEKQQNPRQKSRRRFIIIGVVTILIVGVVLFWWHSTFYQDTDDAQVDGHLVQVSARVSGNVVRVNVEENQQVKAGDVLVEMDPKDYQTVIAQDQANLEAAEANYESAKVNVPVTNVSAGSNISEAGANVLQSADQVQQAQHQMDAARAQVAQADANYTKAKLDVERYTPLVQKDVISKQQFDQAVATAAADEAALNQAKSNLSAAEASVRMAQASVQANQARLRNAQTGPRQVEIQRARADQAAAQVEQARASLEQAKLNLSYTRIVAPVNGIVTRKSVELGQNVASGQNMMTLVSLDDVWITANFKETQLNRMRPGQPVEITVDAYGGRKYDGKVTQIGGATGSMLSLFPPENATGNYVKVVQRIPVRIDLTRRDEDSDHLLRPGLSVEPKVRVKD